MSYLYCIVSFLTKVPFVLRDLEVADFCDLKLWLSCKPGFCWNLYAICLFCVWDHFLRKLFCTYFFLVLGKKSYSLIITKIHFVFLRGRQNIMLLCERNYWTDWQVHRSVFTAWNSIWFSLRLFGFAFDIFSILMYILIFKFWSIICYRLQMFICKVSKLILTLFSSIN